MQSETGPSNGARAYAMAKALIFGSILSFLVLMNAFANLEVYWIDSTLEAAAAKMQEIQSQLDLAPKAITTSTREALIAAVENSLEDVSSSIWQASNQTKAMKNQDVLWYGVLNKDGIDRRLTRCHYGILAASARLDGLKEYKHTIKTQTR